MQFEAKPEFGMGPITVTLSGETACYLLQALKKAIRYGNLDPTGVRVYEEVAQAIVAGFDPPLAEAGSVCRGGTP